MATGTVIRRSAGPLLGLNLIMYLLVIGFASWSMNKYINGENHPHLAGNTATMYFLIFSLIAGVLGVCSIFAGMLHLRAWRNDSLAAAASSALISWSFTALSFGVAIKEIRIGNRGNRLKTLEAFIIILTITQFLYVMMLHAGIANRKYGPGNRDQGTGYAGMAQEPQKPAHPVV